jgi:hypothetical protein
MSLKILRAAEQDRGAFDAGKITERKPVNFPGQGSQTERYGPLLYWAWAASEKGGLIAEHPHQGFEIFSYVLQGKLEHRDSLGSWKSLRAGELQVMQTNSGVSHSERFAEGEHTEMFQIWLEPHLRESLRRSPIYADYTVDKFPWQQNDGYRIKRIIGNEAPVQLVTEAQFDEVIASPSSRYIFKTQDAFGILVAIEGFGEIGKGTDAVRLSRGDAAYLKLESDEPYRVRGVDRDFRFAQIIVPARISYPLYPNY